MDEKQANLIPHTSGITNYAILKFGNATSQNPSVYSYMVVFPYGSTVLFNMLDDEVDRYLKIIERHASGLLGTSKDVGSFQNYHIKYEVRENSNLPMWMQGGQGSMMLQHLDTDGYRVISSVLGQSIALDYYVRKANGVIAAFTELPCGRWTIRSYIMRKKRMNQLVGSANSTLADLIVKVGLFDRSEITFREDPNYSQMLEFRKDQFEFNQKFVGLDFYLRLMERYIAFVGAETEPRIFVLGAGLFRKYGVLMYFFSPFIPALGSLVHTIIVKTNIGFT
ncbi:hypothetical protein MKX01_029690 [Papaver californicum]|nr:hypothetical protein MKX01_029690 [Papaver californicum]